MNFHKKKQMPKLLIQMLDYMQDFEPKINILTVRHKSCVITAMSFFVFTKRTWLFIMTAFVQITYFKFMAQFPS